MSAPPGDTDYLLRDLDVTPLLFKTGSRPASNAPPSTDSMPNAHVDGVVYEDVLRFLAKHPGAHMNDLRTHVRALGECSYPQARETIVRMIDLGLVEIAGQVPLEQLDERYERLPACDLCGDPSAEHPVVFWKHNTPVVRCTTCGLLYSNPRWKTEFLISYYDDSYVQDYALNMRESLADPEEYALRWLPFLGVLDTARQTNRLLDVGCATGEFMLAAQTRGWETYGIEPAAGAAELARQFTGGEVHAGTFDTATYPDDWFDVVTLWEVIEHVQSPTDYIAKVARVMRPGGLLGISTPNLRCLNYWALGPHWSAVGPNGHLYYFSPRTLKRLLAKHGFSVLGMYTVVAEYEQPPPGLGYRFRGSVSRLLRKTARPVLQRTLLGEALSVIARRE